VIDFSDSALITYSTIPDIDALASNLHPEVLTGRRMFEQSFGTKVLNLVIKETQLQVQLLSVKLNWFNHMASFAFSIRTMSGTYFDIPNLTAFVDARNWSQLPYQQGSTMPVEYQKSKEFFFFQRERNVFYNEWRPYSCHPNPAFISCWSTGYRGFI
jgi:hypothetical protein